MNVVRNIVFVVASVAAALVAVSAAGLFHAVVQVPSTPSGNPTPGGGNGGSGVGTTMPALPAGAQIAFGSANSVTAPTGTPTPPNTLSDATGGVQGFVGSLPSDYAANYATQSAPLLQAYIDSLRATATVPALAYDPVLGQAAANLISDTIASGQSIPAQGSAVNSKGQTPIQQVKVVDPKSTAMFVSALIFVSDVLTVMEATDPQTGLSPAEVNFQSDSNMIPINPSWTHYGLAVVTVPAVPNVSNATRYYVIFFAKE